MAQRELQEKDIVGLKHLKRVYALLEKLREVGCARDKAGNRNLRFDYYCKLVRTTNPKFGRLGQWVRCH